MDLKAENVQVCRLCSAIIPNVPTDIITHFAFTHHFSNKIIHISDNTIETIPNDAFLARMYKELRNF